MATETSVLDDAWDEAAGEYITYQALLLKADGDEKLPIALASCPAGMQPLPLEAERSLGLFEVPQNAPGSGKKASEGDKNRVIIYCALALLPCLALTPFMLSSRELIALDLPPVEI